MDIHPPAGPVHNVKVKRLVSVYNPQQQYPRLQNRLLDTIALAVGH